MDDDFKTLEEELKRLRPVAPSPELHRHLETELQPAEPKSFHSWGWLAFPAAAALAITGQFFWSHPASEKPPAAATTVVAAPAVQFKPVTAENLLLDARDEGYVTLTDGTPARRVRQSYVDTITWKNPGTNASLVWSVPREEVRVVPVNYQ